MNHAEKRDFTAWEYKEVTVRSEKASLTLDGYESFGWQLDEHFPPQENGGTVTFKLRRDRRLVNRTELTRLQRNFEADLDEIAALERSRTSEAAITALVIGLLGTAFMAGSVFAVVADPPRILLSILLAVPAFAGWIAPVFVYRWVRARKTRKVAPFLEDKLNEIDTMCEKGQSLL